MSFTLLVKRQLLLIKKSKGFLLKVKKNSCSHYCRKDATYPWSTKVNLPSILIRDTYSIGRTLILLSLSMIFLSHDVLICPTATKQLKSQLSSESSCSFMSRLEEGQDLRYPVQCITVKDFLSVKCVYIDNCKTLQNSTMLRLVCTDFCYSILWCSDFYFVIKYSDARLNNFFSICDYFKVLISHQLFYFINEHW